MQAMTKWGPSMFVKVIDNAGLRDDYKAENGGRGQGRLPGYEY